MAIGAAAEDYSRQIRCSTCRMLLLTCDACSEEMQQQQQQQQRSMLCELCSDRQARVVTLRAILNGGFPLARVHLFSSSSHLTPSLLLFTSSYCLLLLTSSYCRL